MEKDRYIDGQTLHYEVSGEGKPLILMHGWGCNLTTVRSIAATAAVTHKVYNIDMPGFGKSPEPTGAWGVEDYTKLIERFISLEGLDNPILVGHSFGGRIAILLASRNKNLDSVVLVDAAGIKPHRTPKYYAKVYSFKIAKMLMRAFLSREKYELRIEAMRAKRGSSDYSSATPIMRAIMSRVVNEDLSDRLPMICVPVLLIWGEDDKATPLADAKKMERLIPDAGLVAFSGCGHYSFLDNPIQFKAVLNSFLSSRLN